VNTLEHAAIAPVCLPSFEDAICLKFTQQVFPQKRYLLIWGRDTAWAAKLHLLISLFHGTALGNI